MQNTNKNTTPTQMGQCLPALRPPKRRDVKLRDALDNVKTGDLILFAGSSKFSHLIEMATQSYSHIGMIVIVDPDAEGAPESVRASGSRVMLWHSPAHSHIPDTLTGKYENGPRLVDLTLALSEYDKGDLVVLRRLNMATEDLEDALFDPQPWDGPLVNFMRRTADTSLYEDDPINLVNMGMDRQFGTGHVDYEHFTCSGLISYTWKNMGWMDMHENVYADFTPKSFTPGGEVGVSIKVDVIESIGAESAIVNWCHSSKRAQRENLDRFEDGMGTGTGTRRMSELSPGAEAIRMALIRS